jgi:exopolyphosphatase/guanosine-5'-triphosphate,3'-diphosphate pyrophosphatase
MPSDACLAAVDLGSNSFRLEIGRFDARQLLRIEYLKETVRLGSGLGPNGCLTTAAIAPALACLARFGARLAGFAPQQVRAVATQTLREARNPDAFLAPAQQALGFPIEVISGPAEARLIYQGATHSLPACGERRLVVDIGGRSTELAVGEGYAPLHVESCPLGSVAWSMRYFAGGELSAPAFEQAEIAAGAVLGAAARACTGANWQQAYGCSGTIDAVAVALAAAGRAPAPNTIDRAGLLWLRKKLLEAGHVERIRINGIRENRKPVIAGGLAVLRAVFELLGIEHMRYTSGALRHGVLYGLMERQCGQAALSVQD